MSKNYFILLLFSFLIACSNEPQRMTPIDNTGSALDRATQAPQSFEEPSQRGGVDGEMHQVTVHEVLQTDKYTYLLVKEGQEERWLAVSKMSAVEGQELVYDGALMKKNFYSREFDRTFETIYLVSRVVPAKRTGQISSSNVDEDAGWTRQEVAPSGDEVPLKDLISNAIEYQGKQILVKGQVVKVNNNIMGRNWIHLQDGSQMDGELTDLTITSQESFPLGAVVIMKGTVVTNQDFGAGYKYKVLLENGAMVR